MKKHNYLLKALGISVAYWLLDSGIHWLATSEEFELLPHEHNELWMRLMIISLLLAFGAYADYKTNQLIAKEKEKHRVFKATVYSTQHILNNLLNQLQLIKITLEESNTLTDEVSQTINHILESGTEQVNKLSQVEDISEESIKKSVYPEN